MENKKSYYAIIPADVRYDARLKLLSRMLYGEITALCNEKGYCWATNKYFAELYKVSNVTISTCISQLKDLGYINVEINYKEGTKEILNRYLKILNDPHKENLNTPIKEIFKDNNTSINNTINNITSSTFTPPTLEEVKEYCKQRNNFVDAKQFYDYYSAGDWKDKNGKQIKNWKQKMIANWEKKASNQSSKPQRKEPEIHYRTLKELEAEGLI